MINLKKEGIKNIIFDLGGIILNIDFQLSVEEFKKLGFDSFGKVLDDYLLNNFFHNFEKGLTSEKEFIIKISEISSKTISESQFYNAWNKMILDFPSERIEAIQNLRKNYKLFLLSNTNIIHYNLYNKIFSNNFNLPGLESLFDKAYFSHQIGMRKPDLEIFEFVLRENNLISTETLFIDDFTENIESANKTGIKTLQIKTNDEFNKKIE